jgi:predicted ester cyclase
MSPDENKALVQRLYDDLFNRGRLRLADQLIAPDFVNHVVPPGTPQGPDGVRHIITMLRSACPDSRYVIEDLIAEDDKVAARVTFSGTHAGVFQGLPPTGQRVLQEQIHILRIAGERGAELWAAWDNLALLRHVGGRVVRAGKERHRAAAEEEGPGAIQP